MSDSAITRSTGELLQTWPFEERAPRMHWMADLKSASYPVHGLAVLLFPLIGEFRDKYFVEICGLPRKTSTSRHLRNIKYLPSLHRESISSLIL